MCIQVILMRKQGDGKYSVFECFALIFRRVATVPEGYFFKSDCETWPSETIAVLIGYITADAECFAQIRSVMSFQSG